MKIIPPLVACCVGLLLFGEARAQEVFADSLLIYSTDHKRATVATQDTFFTVKEIVVNGNRRTRRTTILRELDFRANDAFPFVVLSEKLEEGRQQLMNTNLFRSVTIGLRNVSDSNVTVNITVEEKWYFYPQPFVRIANGTFSQWNERGRRLDHLNYGLKLAQHNFSGRGDKASINFAEGYTKKMGIQYQGFYFDRALKWAGNINISHGKNREINYQTRDNKLLAVKNPEGFLYEFYNGSFELIHRPAIRTRHVFAIGYQYNRVSDTVRKLNENFTPSENVYRYPYISYGLSFTDYNFNPYPTRGRAVGGSIYKAGLNDDINLWQLSVKGTNYWALGPKGYFSLQMAGTLKLPFKQPYIMQGFLGYGDNYLQGYENYFVDGVAGGYAKQTLGLNVFSKAIPLPNIKWLKNLRTIPVQVFAKAYTNQGYAHHPSPGPNNGLANRMLYSSGLGLDIIAFTDLIFKFEWSFNQLGQNGLFLHQ